MSKPFCFLFLCLLWITICYAPGLKETFFQIDDHSLISIPQLRAALSIETLKTLITPGNHIDYYPLRDFSYWMDIHLFGADAFGSDGIVFRLHNFFWVGLSTWMIFLILRLSQLSSMLAAVLAGIWLLHPVHSEMLMWPSARKDCMGMGLGLIAVYAYFRKWKTPSLLAFVGSLASKASLSLLPLCVPVYGLLSRDQKIWKRNNLSIWAPAAAIGLVSSLVQSRFYSQYNDMQLFYSWDYRLKASLTAFGRMCTGFFLPSVNAIDVENWGNWADLNQKFIYIGFFLFLFLIAFTVWTAISRKKELLAGATAFWLIYFPVSSLLFFHRNFYSVRYFELPLLALSLGIVTFYSKQLKERITGVTATLTTVFVLAGIGTYFESQNWHDSLGPLQKSLRLTPDNPALLRFVYQELRNIDRWGRLTSDQRTVKDQVGAQLESLCGGKNSASDFRNSHLCVGLWIDELIQKRSSLRFSGNISELAIQSLKEVNPKSELRMMDQPEFYDKLRKNSAISLLEFQSYKAHSQSLVSPAKRMTLWHLQCLAGQHQQASELLSSWSNAHLIDQHVITRYLANIRTQDQIHYQTTDRVLPCLEMKRLTRQ